MSEITRVHFSGPLYTPIMEYPPRTSGFTLIELIMVIVLLGTLSVFVVPRFFQKTSFDSLAFEQELKTAIRFAHTLSIASGCEVQVSLTVSSYALYFPDSSCNPPDAFGANPVNHPMQTGNYTGTAPTGITISGFGDFYFNDVGTPDASGNITVNPGGRQITVMPLTGYVR
jgi:MSHA pilin protein MshC